MGGKLGRFVIVSDDWSQTAGVIYAVRLAQTCTTAFGRGGGSPASLGAARFGQNGYRLGYVVGGWAVPERGLGQGSVVYSAGAGEDLSFDVALAERFGCEVHIFDPTPRAVTHFCQLEEATRRGELLPINGSPKMHYALSEEGLSRLHFHEVGIFDVHDFMRLFAPANPLHVSHSLADFHGTGKFFAARCRPLRELMEDFGNDQIDLSKMDVEGAEVSVLRDML